MIRVKGVIIKGQNEIIELIAMLGKAAF